MVVDVKTKTTAFMHALYSGEKTIYESKNMCYGEFRFISFVSCVDAESRRRQQTLLVRIGRRNVCFVRFPSSEQYAYVHSDNGMGA